MVTLKNDDMKTRQKFQSIRMGTSLFYYFFTMVTSTCIFRPTSSKFWSKLKINNNEIYTHVILNWQIKSPPAPPPNPNSSYTGKMVFPREWRTRWKETRLQIQALGHNSHRHRICADCPLCHAKTYIARLNLLHDIDLVMNLHVKVKAT